jgi:molecular chaperone DnaJ
MSAATADWLTKDFYAVLGVPPTATDKQITRAYRKLARELHPDTRSGGGSDDRFKDVAAAYDVLGNEAKRKEYDELRAAAAARSAGRGARGRSSRSWGAEPDGVRIHVQRRGGQPSAAPLSDSDAFYEVFDGITLEDLLGGHRGYASSSGTSARRSRPGRDLRTTIRLSLEQAVRGATVEIPLDAPLPHSVTARIPAGVVDGQTVRLPGRGEPGTAGGPPGDLLVQVAVEPHPLFGRDGRSLTLTVPITFPEAALGADIAVATLDGPVTVRIPPGTGSGTTLRVRGRGVPGDGGAEPGDLLVTVQVDVPKHLSDEQRAAIEQLAAATPSSPRRNLGG